MNIYQDALFHVARGRHGRAARLGFAGVAHPVDTGGLASVAFGGDGRCTLLGGFIGGFTVAFDEKWAGNRIQARWVAMGTWGLASAQAWCPAHYIGRYARLSLGRCHWARCLAGW